MSRSAQSAFVTLILLGCFVVPTLADQEGGGFAYKAYTADQKHVFVMLNQANRLQPAYKDDLYPESGMYLNDGSVISLWTVDWSGRVYLPNGGKFVVRRGPWARYSGRYNEEALTFFYRDQLLRSYRSKDLVDFPWLLSHTASHYTWSPPECATRPGFEDGSVVSVGGNEYPNNTFVRFDDQKKTMEVETQLGDRLMFDLTTGLMISASRPARTICVLAFSILLIVYVFYHYRASGRAKETLISPSNFLIGFLVCGSLISLPTIATFFTGAADVCDGEDAPTLYTRIWLAYYLIPPYFMNLFTDFVADSEILITPGSVGTLMRTALFWSGATAVFAVLDKFVARAFRRLRRSGSQH